jgi:L-seryl-tRNA(Ser) seleniumtransferase
MVAAVDPRRGLPSMEEVLGRPEVRALSQQHGRALVVRQLRRLLGEWRDQAVGGRLPALPGLVPALCARLASAAAPSLVPVINATGVVIHTNLGRAPLSRAAAARVAEIAAGYSNLEFDLASGERGSRETHAETRLSGILGAAAALVVNNNAAAVLLAVNTLAEGREVVVSRGELVEIGGSFRVPDVIRKGGARLREVGTTNRTRLADYRAALGPQTGLILKVHPSNFRMLGFVEHTPLDALVALGRESGVAVGEDMGSGLLEDAPQGEATVAEALSTGADFVSFSGDKLLGGPQAGLVAGQPDRVRAMRQNPLYRALRVDKMTLAALDCVLADHESGSGALRVPVLRMLALDTAALQVRAEALCQSLGERAPQLDPRIEPGHSAVGGGALPAVEPETRLVTLRHPALGATRFAGRLRQGHPAVVTRVAHDRVVLDLRSVQPDEEPALLRVLVAAAGVGDEA